MPLERILRQRQEDPQGGSASDLVAGGPPAVDDTEEDKGPKPLGVPRDYRTTPGPGTPGFYPHGFNYNTSMSGATPGRSYGEGAPGGIKPRYVDGDEWRPASISPQNIVEIQKALATAGLLQPGFLPGVWDYRTANAYVHVLEYANAAGITDQQALQQMAESGLQQQDQEGFGTGLAIKTTSRDDLRRIFRTVSADKLGIAYDQTQIDQMVDAYQAQEIQTQRETHANEQALLRTTAEQGAEAAAGMESVVEETPSPEAFAEEELMRRDPTGVHAGAVVGQAVPMFLDALKAWG